MAFALVFAAFPAGAAAKPVVYAPDATVEGAPPLENGVWAITGERYSARLALLDTATRQAWLLRQLGSSTDPFVSPKDGPPTFLTFLLDLECKGNGRIYFQPIASRLVPPDGDLRNPLDLATIQAVYGMLEKEMPLAYEEILGKVLLQREVDLAPGARATGLLAFRVADLKAKRFRLELHFTGPNGEELGFQVPYVALKAGATPGAK